MPRFSVIVPAYNASATIRETLDSVLAQEFDDWECVIVDDGSTDDTAEIVGSYVERDPRFRLIRQENQGAAGAYRSGVGAAKADLLVICAADDLLLPEHLHVMDEFIRKNPAYGIYSSNGEYLEHESGERTTVYSDEEWLSERSFSFEELVRACFFSVGAVITRATYEVAGGHRSGVYVDDYDLWLRALARGIRHRYTPRRLSVNRVSSFRQSADMERVYRSGIEVYEHLLAHESLTQDQRDLLAEAIRRNRDVIADLELARQSDSLRRTVERLVGKERAVPVLDGLRRVSRFTRPARHSIARMLRGYADSTIRRRR